MGYTKDQWTRPERGPDGMIRKDARGKAVRARNDRWGKGKRWLACWIDLNGVERSEAFKTQAAADRHWKAMETDKERGEYIDSEAGRVLFGDLGKRWLVSRVLDPSSQRRYESVYRLHVDPRFGRHQVKAIKPSAIQAWIGELSQRFDTSTVLAAFMVLHGILEMAVADEALKKNPAKSQIVQVPKRQGSKIVAWADDRVCT